MLSDTQVQRAEGLLGIDGDALRPGLQRLRPRAVPAAPGRPRGALAAPPRRRAAGLAAGRGGRQRRLRGRRTCEAFAGGPTLLYVGRFTAVKRVGLLIEAYARARLAFEHPAPLVIVGGYPGEWEGEHPADTIARTGAEGVFLAGWHGHDELPGFLNASDVVVLPSVREQFGQVLVEGMACGLPAIAVDAHGPGGDRQRRRDGLAGRARRPRRARRGARGGRQPARGAPPARRAGPRSGAGALFLARAGRGGRGGLRGGPGRGVGRFVQLSIFAPPEPLLPFRAPPQGPRPRTGSTPMHRRTARPTQPVGLYDPSYEHDACGVAMVARLSGDPCHETVQRAVVALENLEHRGAAGADPNTGDGAGMLLQLPDELLRAVIGSDLPPPGRYGVAVCFLPQDDERRAELEALLTEHRRGRGPARRRLARRAGRQGLRRHHRQLLRALHQAARRRGRHAGLPGGPGRLRAPALRDPPRRRARRRPRPRGALVLEPHDRLQGHAHGPAAARLLPRPAGPRAPRRRSRSSTRASRPTRSRAGSSRTRTATSPTTARSTRCAATSTGCARASPSSPPSCSARATSRSCCRSCAPAARTRRRSTTCSSCSCSRAARCPTR